MLPQHPKDAIQMIDSLYPQTTPYHLQSQHLNGKSTNQKRSLLARLRNRRRQVNR